MNCFFSLIFCFFSNIACSTPYKMEIDSQKNEGSFSSGASSSIQQGGFTLSQAQFQNTLTDNVFLLRKAKENLSAIATKKVTMLTDISKNFLAVRSKESTFSERFKGNMPRVNEIVSSKKRFRDPSFAVDDGGFWRENVHLIPEERGRSIREKIAKALIAIAKQLGTKKTTFYTQEPQNVAWYASKGGEALEKRLFRKHTLTIMRFRF